MSDSPSASKCSLRKHRSTPFDFDTLCIFCGELARGKKNREKGENIDESLDV